MNLKFSIKDIIESAIFVALAIVLDFKGLKISIGTNGGSISLTMIPLFILALRQGPLKSFISIGIIYGLITCLIDGWGIQYFPFDYLLAYGSISILGFFNKKILNNKSEIQSFVFLIITSLFCLVLRLLFHTISGMIFYKYSFVFSLLYNLPYVMLSGIFCLIILILLLKPLKILNEKYISKSID